MYLKKYEWINVENLNIEESIKKYNPDLIISSWMPEWEEWTSFFRKSKNLNSFLLIWAPIDCWTINSWKECENFKPKKLEIEWNICWRDLSFEWNNIKKWSSKSQSKIILFERK